jgi:TetR/AcrR family fatty acid metabolism transcriptional regulator
MSKTVLPSTRREKMEAKERAILDAARIEFSERGFENAKMSAIAKRAEVAEGTVYLYYRNKKELLDAVVAQFWQVLTQGARKVTLDQNDTLAKLKALADFHLCELVKDFDFVGFTVRTRETGTLDSPSLNPIRGYVAVFDEIFQQGVDRGIFQETAPLWVIRDLFYGTLEYSSRTLHLHKTRGAHAVTQHLTEIFMTLYSNVKTASSTTGLERIEERLASIETKLDTRL